MAKRVEYCECHKCGGSGYIADFAGIANGVCFTCDGNGKVKYRPTKVQVKPLTEHQAKWIEAIKTADMSNWTYKQLAYARDFAHWPTPHCHDLLAIWKERGEAHFQAAQEAKLAEFYANS